MAVHGDDVDRTEEWATMRARHLVAPDARAESSARGLHHLALLSSDVEQTIAFYQGVLEFPLTELFENRDYRGSTHFFFDIGNGNLLAFFDFPGLDLGDYAEVLGHVYECPKAAWYLTANDDQGGGTYQVIEALRDRIDVVVQALSFNSRFLGDLLVRIEEDVQPADVVPRQIVFSETEDRKSVV